MTLIATLGSVIFGLLAIISALWNKKNNAEALNQNNDVKNQINQSSQEVAKDQGLLEAEAQKQADLEKQKAQADSQDPSRQQLLDELNKK